MPSITPFLWFDHQAEEAVNYYVAVFPEAEIKSVSRYPESGPGPAGGVMTVAFRLLGQDFIALNGGPHFTFNEAVSFVINCETQAEIDHYWERLSAGGQPGRCGWLKDRYGLSWQIVPTVLGRLLGDSDPETNSRVMAALLDMDKLDIRVLQQAHDQV